MESIITSNLKEITLKSEFLTLRTPNGEMEVDIKRLLKEPVGSDSAYFNATQICKHFNRDISKFMRTDGTKEYIEKMEIFLNSPKKAYLKNPIKMVKTVRGKYHSGTWLHSKMFIKFARWISVDFEIAMDNLVSTLITHSNELKLERASTKFNFTPLTDAIRDIYIPAQTNDKSKQYAYSTLSNLINIIALGCSAKKYREDNKLEDDIEIRDVLPKQQLEHIDRLEVDLHGYIKYAKITDYETLKDKLAN
jgi:hypothetical protein